MESVTLVTEPLLHRDFVQFEIVVPILERLSSQYDITIAAPQIAPEVQEELERRNIRPANGGAHFPPIRRPRDEIPSYIVSWARDTLWGMNRRDIERVLHGVDGIRINISMTTAIDADVWLVQSRPLGQGLDAMRRGLGLPMRAALTGANPFVGRLDLHHMLDAGRRVRERYTTTRHVADWFESKGLPVTGVMPMYYRPTVRRSTSNPSRDFIFVYVGKETDTTALRMLLDTGLPVTMFGSKSVGWVMKSLRLDRYPRARLLGHISDEELSDLYSNARFIAFPFTEEPFGLVPLEAMACGTPVLTYGEQGPAESVVDGRTGWLVRSREEFVRRAVELWNAGPPSSLMVERCMARARNYHLDTVRSGWHHIIESAFERSGEEAPRLRPRSWVRPEPAFTAERLVPGRTFAEGPESVRSFSGLDPDMLPANPAVEPLGEFPSLILRSHSSDARSGGYFNLPETDRIGVGPDAGPNEDGPPYPFGPKSPPDFAGTGTPTISRRAVPDASTSSPL